MTSSYWTSILQTDAFTTSALCIIISTIILPLYLIFPWPISLFLTIPGPLVPKSIFGDLQDLMQEPTKFGPNNVAKYGRMYRIFIWMNPVLVLADARYCE